MTDRPHAGGSTETAVGPEPGYYPDPSVPGFVRYWGGSAWVPGTSRAAPAEGQVLEPPRYATRRPAAAAGAGAGARYVPPPVAAEPVAVPVSLPVYLDRTAGGASFTFAAPGNGPVFRRGGEPAPVDGAAGPAPDPEPEAPAHPAPESAGWQADPRAQRGLMETGSAPRWVSWGVLPGAEEPSGEAPGAVSAEAPAPLVTPLAGSASPAAPGPDEPRSVPVPRVSAPAPSAVVEPPPRPEPEAEPEAVVDVVEAVEPPPAATVPARRPAPAATAAATASARASSTARRRRTGAAPDPRPAGLGRRLVARLVDTAVLAVVAVAAGVPLGRSVEAHLQRKLDQARMASRLTRRQVDVWLVDGTVLGKVAVLLGILLFVGLLYEALPTARTGQTFGKRLARIRVVATARAGSAAAPGRPRLGRSVVRWLVGQVTALLVVGLLWPLFDRPARRGWHDRAARTRVVRL
ncbi:RDD family protein [Kitasatospora purpeofusca]|uniref:RDD family protein n=1 Tax=Kitasatospora purpeofusca TaxID=67352 RepID=UPI002A5988EC|nr:RDD family protein [Kitasatospora purpeofusca]MDY0810237.1 RDD family protein [Kitasatospora purpeofusca]